MQHLTFFLGVHSVCCTTWVQLRYWQFLTYFKDSETKHVRSNQSQQNIRLRWIGVNSQCLFSSLYIGQKSEFQSQRKFQNQAREMK